MLKEIWILKGLRQNRKIKLENLLERLYFEHMSIDQAEKLFRANDSQTNITYGSWVILSLIMTVEFISKQVCSFIVILLLMLILETSISLLIPILL